MILQVLAIIFLLLWLMYGIYVFKEEYRWSGKLLAGFTGVMFGCLFAAGTFAFILIALVIVLAAISFIG